MAVCGVKVGIIKLFWKHRTKPDHKHLTRPHSQNMYKGDLSYKLGRLIIALSNDSMDISPELHKRPHSDPL